MTPMIEVIKDLSFKWTLKAQAVFKETKAKLTQAPMSALPCFNKVFEVECDASSMNIGGILTQEDKRLAFFSEKLCDLRRKHSTYDKKFYTIV